MFIISLLWNFFIKTKVVGLWSSVFSIHHLSWFSQSPLSRSRVAVTLLRSPPLGIHSLLTHCPPSPLQPLGVVTLIHSSTRVSPSSIHGPQGSSLLTALKIVTLYRSQPLKLLPSSTLSPRGHLLPLRGREPQDPCTLLPALSPWRADPWLRTPLTPPLKSPPLGNQSGPGHSRRRSA